MHQNPFRSLALPGPAGGAYSAPPDPLAGFGEGEGKERREEEGEGKREGGREGVGREGNILDPLAQKSWRHPCCQGCT